jgi:hypothetical protein
MDMQALISEMDGLIAKIKNGTATLGEIEAFAATAGQLHERALILRYKAYEAKVFGTLVAPVQEIEQPLAPPQPGVKTESVDEQPAPEPVASVASTVEEELPAEKTEQEEMSFDLFDESEEEAQSFDLFSLDGDQITEGSLSVDEAKSAVEHPVHEHIAEPDLDLSPLSAVEANDQSEPEIKEEEAAFSTTSLFADPKEDLPAETEAPLHAHAEDLSAESSIEKEELETPAARPEPAAAITRPEPVVSGDIHPVYKRLVTDDNSLAARLMAVRLETLKGAFGFNERLQIIGELFGSSSETFTEAIEHLDNLSSKAEARAVVSDYARRFGWDKDSDVALEFVQKVERRYA